MKDMNQRVDRMRCDRWVRTLVALTVSLAILAGTALAQSLAEVAEKEKKRRAEAKGATKVISERELQSGRRVTPLPSDSASGSGSPAEGEAASEETAGADEPQVDETKTREYWETRVKAVHDKISGLEQKLQSPESDWGGGMRTDVNPMGQRNLSQRQETESQLAAARAELAQIQDEARRAGVPSGWVR